MKLRVRIDDVHEKHVRATVFEGREHGPMLGQLVFDRPKFANCFGVSRLTEGRTYEADLDLDWPVR